MILECRKGHKWNTTFDMLHSHLVPGDPCPLEIGWGKNKKPPITLCGLPLKKVIFERREKRKKKFEPKKRKPMPYNRSRTRREYNVDGER